MIRQTGEEGWICGGHRAGLSGVSGRETDPGEDSVHPGQRTTPTPPKSDETEEHVQQQAAVPELLHKQTQKLLCPPGHKTV